MRLKIGGKIGPIRAGVSVGRSGVGWGGGAGPIGVTGGTRSRSKSGSNSSSSYSNDSDDVTYEPPKDPHPEDSVGAVVLAYCGGAFLSVVALWTLILFTTRDENDNTIFHPSVFYWLCLGISIGTTTIGILLSIADRSYFQKTGELRPSIFEGKEYPRLKKKLVPFLSYLGLSSDSSTSNLEVRTGRKPIYPSDSDLKNSRPTSKKPAPSHSNSGELVIIDLLVIQKWLDHQPSTNDSADLELFANAIEIVLTSGIGSTSLLQRKLKIGFSRAGYVMDVLEDLGVVGRAEGSKARSVLLKYSDIPRYK